MAAARALLAATPLRRRILKDFKISVNVTILTFDTVFTNIILNAQENANGFGFRSRKPAARALKHTRELPLAQSSLGIENKYSCRVRSQDFHFLSVASSTLNEATCGRQAVI